MRAIQYLTIALFVLLLASGCSKNLLDKELNYNPFDPEYVGESPFVLISATPFNEVVSGGLVQKIRVRFSVNQSLFTSEQPFYYVLVQDENGEQAQSISSLTNSEGYFEYEYEHPPQDNCVYLYLQSGLSNSGKFSLCFTF
jgi:hypothetical protein